MSKLTRAIMKVFGDTGSTGQFNKIGSLAAGSIVTTKDPVVMQQLSNYSDGLFSVVIGGNSPSIQDINAIYYLFSRQLAYLMQTGIAEWDATTTYYIGSLATAVGTGVIYVSLTNTNLNNAVTDTTNWKPLLNPLYQVILGSAAQVTQGRATHSTWASAIAAASAGDAIYILPGAWTENVSLSKQLSIYGAGYGSSITGTFTITGSTKHCLVRGLRISSTITLDSGCQGNKMYDLFSPLVTATGTPFVDNSGDSPTTNLLEALGD